MLPLRRLKLKGSISRMIALLPILLINFAFLMYPISKGARGLLVLLG